MYSICEMVLGFASSRDLDIACHHLKFLEREVLPGCQSSYYATKILELKGLDNDEKTTLIHERLMRLVERFPDQFGYDLFEEMQQFSITAKHQFKAVRRTSEHSRLIMVSIGFAKGWKRQLPYSRECGMWRSSAAQSCFTRLLGLSGLSPYVLASTS